MKIVNLRVILAALVAALAHSAGATLSASAFFSYPDAVTVRLSPAGTTLAILQVQSSGHRIWIRSSTGKEGLSERRLLFDTAELTDDGGQIRQLEWIDNRYLAVELSEDREGVANLVDSVRQRRLLVVDTAMENRNAIYSVRTAGYLVHPLPDSDGEFLYARSGLRSQVYKLKTADLDLDGRQLGKLDRKDGGQFVKANEMAYVDGYATHWFVVDGSIKSALTVDGTRSYSIVTFLADGSRDVAEVWKSSRSSNERKLVPIAFADDNLYYCLDAHESEKRSVYLVNFANSEEQRVYQTTSYRILDIILSDDRQLVGLKVINNGRLSYEFIGQPFADNGGDVLKYRYDYSSDGRRHLMYSEGHSLPGRFTLVDEAASTETLVTRQHSQLTLNSRLIEGRVEVEGLQISYLLTLPDRPPPGGHPLVVMPHGGPIGVFDDRYYDAHTAFLAAQGFAVLRVNFRGSGGHSAELENAGKRQWGDLMLEDIRQATLEVVKRDDVANSRACTFGMSYGGYAATMLLIKHPGIYKCGVTVNGITDVPLYLNSPLVNRRQRVWLKEQLGTADTEHESLKSISPVYRAHELERPLFIVHGEQDATVDIEHAWRMKLMLEKRAKTFEWHIMKDTGHSTGSPETTARLFDLAVDFIRRNIEAP